MSTECESSVLCGACLLDVTVTVETAAAPAAAVATGVATFAQRKGTVE